MRHPRARRYVLRVKPDGTVRVTVPRWGSRRAARDFAEAQRAWIERQRHRIEARRQQLRDRLAPGVVEALRLRAATELRDEVRRLARIHGLTVARVSVRNQRWRWGSCSPQGHICLNWRLVLMPDYVRDYVVVHELMHLRRLDHSAAFWKLVKAACPTCTEARKWLRANAHLLQFGPEGLHAEG